MQIQILADTPDLAVTTSRPAGGTEQRQCYRGSAHTPHSYTSSVYPHPEYRCLGLAPEFPSELIEQVAENAKRVICGRCGGTGTVTIGTGRRATQVTCSVCGGTGEVWGR